MRPSKGRSEKEQSAFEQQEGMWGKGRKLVDYQGDPHLCAPNGNGGKSGR